MSDRVENSNTPAAQTAAEDLKAGGFIPQRQPGKITIRCKTPGGRISSERLERIAQVAAKFGQGMVHLSVRQSPEIPYVDLSDLEAVVRELGEAGQEIASCGKRFRVATACGGCEYNPNAWTETQRLAQESTARFFGEDTPHKFKVCFAGCVRDCVRSRAADLGFQGLVEPKLAPENCTRCGLCLQACQEEALQMGEDQLPVRDLDRCISCGDCIKACLFDAMIPHRLGHGVFAGGKHGKHPHAAYPLAQFVGDAQVHAVIAATLSWYREHGKRGERLGDVLDRVGVDSYRRALKLVVGDALLAAADLTKPRWKRVYCRGLVETFPPYGEV